MKRTSGEKIFAAVNVVFLLIFAAVCLIPFINVIARSLSSETEILRGAVGLIPKGFSLKAYEAAFKNNSLLISLRFTVILTIVGTATNMLLTILGAFPLSKNHLVFRKPIWVLILFTMFFNGGMIPIYLLVKNVGLIDTIWALILPGAISTYNMIIMMTFFKNIPDSLDESAKLDGCTDIGVLVKIIIPLSTPVIAALSLFYAVGHWNQYMAALLYINTSTKYTLQLRLRQMVPTDAAALAIEGKNLMQIPNESLKSAATIFATIPILLVYPYLQKYFVKGIMLGAVKG